MLSRPVRARAPAWLVGLVGALLALAAPRRARAEDGAPLLVLWAPDPVVHAEATSAAAARVLVVVDRSPAAAPARPWAASLREAVAAYEAVRFEEAAAALDRWLVEAASSGAAEVDRSQLAEAYLYRGLARDHGGDAARGWDDLIAAARLAPGRLLDPARVPPRAIEAHERARAQVARETTVELIVRRPDGCVLVVDAQPQPGGTTLVHPGPRWVRVTCPGHLPWITIVEVAAVGPQVVVADPAPWVRPDDASLAAEARRHDGPTLVLLEEADRITLRRLDRAGRVVRTRTLPRQGLAQTLAPALAVLLADPPRATTRRPAIAAPPRWYQRRWAQVAGAALVAAAIAIPVTAALVDDGGSSTATIRLDDVPW
ncbi:MAG: hypothetical protein KBG28_05590 [Kofleriaceae bacterium]|nr:hypothetical protein [Kofleriaceae bacterium]MBP9203417.1 hypothetical protein [Kofleriaceae bacterium]